MASPVVTSLWRKPATRPQVALARAAATTGAVVVVWGLLRMGGVSPVFGGGVSRMVHGRGRAGNETALGDAALSVNGAPAGAGDGPAALTEAPSAADLEGIRECKDAARNYMLTHLKDFHAESGAWGLKSAMLALRGSLVDTGTETAGNAPTAPLVVDVGANRGQNVPVWRAIYGEAAHMVLVEGNPVAARALSSDFADKSDTVVVVQRLVGNSTKEMNFRVPKGDTSLERAAIQAEESVGLFPDEFDYVKLPVDTLDDILTNPALVPTGWVDPSRQYPIDFLKIDTEGWDVTALQGAPAALQRTRFVLWECHLLMALVNGPGTTHAQAAELLAGHGFESYKVSPQFVRFDGVFAMPEVDERANMGWQNCFAIRSDDPLRPELLGRFNHLFQCVKPLKLVV
ncbi:hypothetical protein MMPV_006905 [Pyropia vietnamensis]